MIGAGVSLLNLFIGQYSLLPDMSPSVQPLICYEEEVLQFLSFLSITQKFNNTMIGYIVLFSGVRCLRKLFQSDRQFSIWLNLVWEWTWVSLAVNGIQSVPLTDQLQ